MNDERQHCSARESGILDVVSLIRPLRAIMALSLIARSCGSRAESDDPLSEIGVVILVVLSMPLFVLSIVYLGAKAQHFGAASARISNRWRHERAHLGGRIGLLPALTRQTIAQTRADVEYEYNLAMSKNRIKDARRIRFIGRFIIVKAATYDLLVTLFEYVTDSIKHMFRQS